MTKGQKISMWVFGLPLCFSLFVIGTQTGPYGDQTNGFIAVVSPLIILGLMSFFSFGNKNK